MADVTITISVGGADARDQDVAGAQGSGNQSTPGAPDSAEGARELGGLSVAEQSASAPDESVGALDSQASGDQAPPMELAELDGLAAAEGAEGSDAPPPDDE
jgi:hypothetical protein